MKSVALRTLVMYCDRVLRNSEFQDWDGAWNGLQVENSGRVTRIAAAVDARQSTIAAARALGANLLLVHHGLFWGTTLPWTGHRYELLRELFAGDLAVYSSHLPLDAHPRLGNNVRLSRALKLKATRPFMEVKGRKIGLLTEMNLARDELAARLAAVMGKPALLMPFGPRRCARIGIVTGGAGTELPQASRDGIDTFITGEGPHWTHVLAEELKMNVFYAGHYATETFGVRALAAELSRRFGVPWDFIDCPTGL
jgi:dinuclear metal center YbgI/SA1388 family protein